MLSLRIVILHHTTRQGSHYDWLMEFPYTSADPQSLLWAARIEHPPWLWRGDRMQLLTPLAPHRRHYLQYQGPISNGRGSVQRIAQGLFHPICWTTSQLRLQIHWQTSEPYTPMLVDVTTAAQSNWFVTKSSDAGIIPAPAL